MNENTLLTLQLIGGIAKIFTGISTAGIGCYDVHNAREGKRLLLEQKDVKFVSDDDDFFDEDDETKENN